MKIKDGWQTIVQGYTNQWVTDEIRLKKGDSFEFEKMFRQNKDYEFKILIKNLRKDLKLCIEGQEKVFDNTI